MPFILNAPCRPRPCSRPTPYCPGGPRDHKGECPGPGVNTDPVSWLPWGPSARPPSPTGEELLSFSPKQQSEGHTPGARPTPDHSPLAAPGTPWGTWEGGCKSLVSRLWSGRVLADTTEKG